MIFDEDVENVKKICDQMQKEGKISHTPNDMVIKMLIQMANIIQQEDGKMPYSVLIPSATAEKSDLIDLIFAVAIARHIPGKGQNEGEIRPFENALVGWRAFGKSREDEDIIAEAMGFERADYIGSADYFSAGQGNFKPDLVDPTNGYTFDVKSFGSIDSVNGQKNRAALFILLTNPFSGKVSLYIKEQKEGEVAPGSPYTDYKLIGKEYDSGNAKLNAAIKNYLEKLEGIRVPPRDGSSYKIPSRALGGEELFTEDNFKILDVLLLYLGFTWPLRKE